MVPFTITWQIVLKYKGKNKRNRKTRVIKQHKGQSGRTLRNSTNEESTGVKSLLPTDSSWIHQTLFFKSLQWNPTLESFHLEALITATIPDGFFLFSFSFYFSFFLSFLRSSSIYLSVAQI